MLLPCRYLYFELLNFVFQKPSGFFSSYSKEKWIEKLWHYSLYTLLQTIILMYNLRLYAKLLIVAVPGKMYWLTMIYAAFIF